MIQQPSNELKIHVIETRMWSWGADPVGVWHAFEKMWVWLHSWVCHGKTKMQIIGPAHGTWYQQAHYVNISCLWCFAFAVIPSLKVHLELKVFNTHVRVYKVAASWKLRKGMYHPKLPSERKPRISKPQLLRRLNYQSHYCGKSVFILRW